MHSRLNASVILVSCLCLCSALGCSTDDRRIATTDAGLPQAGPTDAQSVDASADTATDSASDAPTADSTPPACTPTPGTEDVRISCADFELAIMVNGDGTSSANLTGHLFGFDRETACATVDEVEVLAGGETITNWPGAGVLGEASSGTLLASGPVTSEMTARCESTTERFGGFGFLIRGRIEGGTFEARCADAEGSYRWPPALRVTCHENLDAIPSPFNYAEVRTFGAGTTHTTFNITVPHGPGGALLTLDPDMTVMTGVYMGGTLEPLLVTGASSLHESDAPVPGVHTSVSIQLDGNPLTEEHCPTPVAMPEIDDDLPPVMLLQFSGTGERGAFSTEAYVDNCNRVTPR